jgi:hypothetical protein
MGGECDLCQVRKKRARTVAPDATVELFFLLFPNARACVQPRPHAAPACRETCDHGRESRCACTALPLTVLRPRRALFQDLPLKISSLRARIAKERKMLEGFQAMSSATSNSDVIRTCEAKMRESARTIGWFEESLRELEDRLAAEAQGMQGVQAGGFGMGTVDPRMRSLPPPPPGAGPSYVSETQRGRVDQQGVLGPKPKIVYTSLGSSLAPRLNACLMRRNLQTSSRPTLP